jgi:hypothetical protein
VRLGFQYPMWKERTFRPGGKPRAGDQFWRMPQIAADSDGMNTLATDPFAPPFPGPTSIYCVFQYSPASTCPITTKLMWIFSFPILKVFLEYCKKYAGCELRIVFAALEDPTTTSYCRNGRCCRGWMLCRTTTRKLWLALRGVSRFSVCAQ